MIMTSLININISVGYHLHPFHGMQQVAVDRAIRTYDRLQAYMFQILRIFHESMTTMTLTHFWPDYGTVSMRALVK